MKKLSLLCSNIILPFILLSSVANAADDNNFYVGVNVGRAAFNGSQFDEKDSAWGLILGWKYNQVIGLELLYTDYQRFTSRIPGQTAPEPSTFSVSGIVRQPLTDSIDIYGKIGMARLSTDMKADVSFYDGTITDYRASFGAGAEWRINDHWNIRLGYETTTLDLGTIPAGSFYANSKDNLAVLSAGILFEF